LQPRDGLYSFSFSITLILITPFHVRAAPLLGVVEAKRQILNGFQSPETALLGEKPGLSTPFSTTRSQQHSAGELPIFEPTVYSIAWLDFPRDGLLLLTDLFGAGGVWAH
jgi:hypothetical protein